MTVVLTIVGLHTVLLLAWLANKAICHRASQAHWQKEYEQEYQYHVELCKEANEAQTLIDRLQKDKAFWRDTAAGWKEKAHGLEAFLRPTKFESDEERAAFEAVAGRNPFVEV